MKTMIATAFLTVCLALPQADAASVTLLASKDATIFQNNPNNGSGAGNGLFAGTNGMNSPRRALLAFDVAAGVPAGSTITGVQLKLVLGQVAGGGTGDQSIELHSVTSPWTEGATQKSDPKTDSIGGQGQGAGALAGDVTWNARSFPSPLWTTAGGDFLGAVSAAASVGSTVNATFTWSSATMVSEVQGWLDAPSTNNGWLLRNAVENVATNFRSFYSRDVATRDFWPRLTITYVPEPTSMILAAAFCGSLVVVSSGRRRGE